MSLSARFLLVNPYYSISETPSPPLGLAFIAAALERAGVEVKILDCVVFPYRRQRLASLLQDFAPQFIGATAVTMTVDAALAVISDAKDLDPDIRTVLGGPHVTFCAQQTLAGNPALDFIVLGEGEQTIVELVHSIMGGGPLEQVAGLAYRRGHGILQTGPRDLLNIDSLPLPARHLVPLGRYRALGMPISMTTSRGCPFPCIFCVGRKMGGAKVRYRDPLKVVDELQALARFGFHQINLADDLFTANRRHCLSVCDEILKRGLIIPWTAFARVDTVSAEVLAGMKAAGCHTISFGVESGNAAILERVRKGITLDQVIAAVQLCNQAGITPHASFILGLPGETQETIAETLAFGERLTAMGVLYGFHLLAPFPGTEVRDHFQHYGLRILSQDWRDYHANRAIVETERVKQDQLDAIAIKWEEKFNQWLAEMAIHRKEGQISAEQAWPLTKLEHTVVLYDMMMGGILEAHGTWPQSQPGPQGGQGVERLAEKVSAHLNHGPQQVVATLRYAVAQGHLTATFSQGQVKWQWVDYLT